MRCCLAVSEIGGLLALVHWGYWLLLRARWGGIGKAADHHILIKRCRGTRRDAKKVNVVVLDKTGTSTEEDSYRCRLVMGIPQEGHYKDIFWRPSFTSQFPPALA